MEAALKKTLRVISLELRHVLEGYYDSQGQWQAGDLERRLNEIGIWRDRAPKLVDELPHLSNKDREARQIVDAYVKLREEAGIDRAAIAEFVREAAYTWANRLFALRCMEARGIIDEVILQKDAYGGRSMMHQRFSRKNPDACGGGDDGLFAVLMDAFEERAKELPRVFDPKSPAIALRPSPAAIKRCIALLSGRESVRGQDPATDTVFEAPDAFGWFCQFWQEDEKERVDNWLKTKKGFKCEGSDIIPKTALYTEPYMVKFLVQNSLGATWMGIHSESKLNEGWEYYVREADRSPTEKKAVSEITFLDPAVGSGHFLLEAFDLFYEMYREEGVLLEPAAISASILNNNLFGIDIDARAIQIAATALWMKAKEKAPDLRSAELVEFHDHLVATNIRLPKSKDHLKVFLTKHPEDEQLRPALSSVFEALGNAPELGSLLQIEEPVERELRRLKEQNITGVSKGIQQKMFGPTIVQGELPVDVESYEEWKHRTLERVKVHFDDEAEASDLVQAFFGEEASRGLVLFNLLTRRYDVVAANPPYMGSKSMGPLLKGYLSRNYTPGRRDLYAAFILLCLRLLGRQGRLGMVTQQSWMFQRSYAELRALDEEGLKKAVKDRFKGLLRETTIETLAHLGPHAFTEITGEVVNIALFTVSIMCPERDHSIVAVRLDDLETSDAKAEVLRRVLRNVALGDARFFRQNQSELTLIFRSPLIYFLGPRYLRHLSTTRPLKSISDIRQGVATTADPRFLRMIWEAPVSKRWVPFEKGDGYSRWASLQNYFVEWELDGIRIKTRIDQRPDQFVWTMRMPKSKAFFRDGLSFSTVGRGAMGARYISGSVFSGKSPFISLSVGDCFAVASLLNSRLASYLLRAIAQGIEFGEGYVRLLPICEGIESDQLLSAVGSGCYSLRSSQFRAVILDRSFDPDTLPLKDITVVPQAVSRVVDGLFADDVARFLAEWYSEQVILKRYELTTKEVCELDENVGRHVGQLPVLKSHEVIPGEVRKRVEYPDEVWDSLRDLEHLAPSASELTQMRLRLRGLYEAGPGFPTTERAIEVHRDDIEDEEQEESEDFGARIPIPAETFLEEVAAQLGIHPISVYYLFKESYEKEGWRCIPEEKRFTEDVIIATVLRLLGHRWPKQIEVSEPVPEWADRDGIIPISGGSGEKSVYERFCDRLLEEVPSASATAINRGLMEIIGTTLEEWLELSFFRQHALRFKKRPIAWQIESQPVSASSTNRGGRRAPTSRPNFSCLIYYHRLDGDSLPKIRSHYVSARQTRFDTELRTLEGLSDSSADQQGRRIELANWILELKAFDERLNKVATHGFGPGYLLTQLRQYAIDDAMLVLKARLLRKLADVIQAGPLGAWEKAAIESDLHPEFPVWILESLRNLSHHCSAVGPPSPNQKSFETDPDSGTLASIICEEARSMAKRSVELSCSVWWGKFKQVVLRPLREKISEATATIKELGKELQLSDLPVAQSRERKVKQEIKLLKSDIAALKKKISVRSATAQAIRDKIEGYYCSEAEQWESWLAGKPLYDETASIDGRRAAPKTIAEFIAQESAYVPDINDGVRVNIAPLQRAGLLSEDVLARKDVDEAIADRAEWRADERRWCREGKLPHPGWWKDDSE